MNVVVSISHLSLWDNNVPNVVYDYILKRVSIWKKEISLLARHHPCVINAFRQYYGFYLERCSYAKLREVPDYLLPFYSILQLSCYGSVSSPEDIEIDVEGCNTYYINTSHYNNVVELLNCKVKCRKGNCENYFLLES